MYINIQVWISFCRFLGTFKRNSEEHLCVQYQESTQEHVGIETRI